MSDERDPELVEQVERVAAKRREQPGYAADEANAQLALFETRHWRELRDEQWRAER